MRTTVVFIQKLLGGTTNATYITLKEAARISGYSSDYIGQLIRAGKLPGKQVYSNVAWVTTEADLMNYIHADDSANSSAASSALTQWWRRATLNRNRLVDVLVGVIVSFLVVILLAFFYISVLALDHTFGAKRVEEYTAGRVIDAQFYESVPFTLTTDPPDR